MDEIKAGKAKGSGCLLTLLAYIIVLAILILIMGGPTLFFLMKGG